MCEARFCTDTASMFISSGMCTGTLGRPTSLDVLKTNPIV